MFSLFLRAVITNEPIFSCQGHQISKAYKMIHWRTIGLITAAVARSLHVASDLSTH